MLIKEDIMPKVNIIGMVPKEKTNIDSAPFIKLPVERA